MLTIHALDCCKLEVLWPWSKSQSPVCLGVPVVVGAACTCTFVYIAAEDGIMHARCHHRSHVLVNFDIDYPACVI